MAVADGWFRVGYRPGEGAGPAPARVGGEAGAAPRAVRPSWSFVALLGEGWAALEGAAGRAALPGGCRDALPSETHVLLLRGASLEAWPLGEGQALGGRPDWRRELRAYPEAAGGGPAAELPLVPGGYAVPEPPDFFRPLSPALHARQLALGLEHAVLLGTAGALFTWGAGRHGQLGHGDLEGASEPRPVEALQGVPMGQVAAGGWHSGSLSEAGDLYMWGWNESGQLGLPSKGSAESAGATMEETKDSGTPSSRAWAQHGDYTETFISIQALPALLDMPGEADVGKVSCGSRHTAALTRTRDLYTWGWGKYGQLGHGDKATSDRPKKVHSFEAWGLEVVDVVCGPWTTFVLTCKDGKNLPLTATKSAGYPEDPKQSLVPTEAASLTFLPTDGSGENLNGHSTGQKEV